MSHILGKISHAKIIQFASNDIIALFYSIYPPCYIVAGYILRQKVPINYYIHFILLHAFLIQAIREPCLKLFWCMTSRVAVFKRSANPNEI